ncbi:hypothetical protein [Pseudomonas sp. microsymbiont 2]
MQFDNVSQIITTHGLVFDLYALTVHPADRPHLCKLYFPSARQASYQISDAAIRIYDRMQAGDRPCALRIMVSRPLSRAQGDALNEQRENVGTLIATAVALPVGFAATITGAVLGMGIAPLVTSRIPTYHAGDRVVALEATVKGGIGPQRSSQAFIIKGQP